MNAYFHFLRPWWFLAFLPLIFCFIFLIHKQVKKTSWATVCDDYLLPFVMENKDQNNVRNAFMSLFIAASFMIVALTGPTWSRLPVPLFQKIMPKVIVLDLSMAMLSKEILPSRLERAKYILHDFLNRTDLGQVALVAYTSEPFVVSPLTEDGKTIDALLPSLNPDIMPVQGQTLWSGLEEATKLIKGAGFSYGQVVVFTGSAPNAKDIAVAGRLVDENIQTSILPLVKSKEFLPVFEPFAKAGDGMILSLEDPLTGLTTWLKAAKGLDHFKFSAHKEVPLWKDEGVWFIFPALLFLAPVFRRGWLERMSS